MLRKFSFIIVGLSIFLVAFVSALLYIERSILPAKIKQITTQKLEEFSGRRVQIAGTRVSLLRGLTIEGLTIFEKDSPETPFLYIKKTSFRVLYFPLLRERKIVIPSLVLDHPQIRLVRYSGNVWNFSDISKALNSRPAAGAVNTPTIARVTIQNAKVLFTDQSLPLVFQKSFEGIDARVRFALPKNIKFSFNVPLAPGSFQAEGNYNLASRKLFAELTSKNFPLSEYIPFYFHTPSLALGGGILSEADFQMTATEKKVDIKGKFKSADLKLDMAPDKKFSGNPSGALSLEYHPADGKFSYEGFVDAKGSKLQGLPLAGNIDILEGKIYFDPEKIKTEAFLLKTFDTNLEIAATLTNFKNPHLNIQGKSKENVPIEKFTDFFPQFFTEKNIKAAGEASLTFRYDGPIDFKEGVGNPVSYLTVFANFDKAELSFSNPPLHLKELSGKISYMRDKVLLENLNGLLADAKLKCGGAITIADLQKPVLDIAGSLSGLDLEEAQKLFPDLFARLPIEKLEGQADLTLKFDGPADSFQKSDFKLTAFLKNTALKLKQFPQPVEALNGKLIFVPKHLFFEDLKGSFGGRAYSLEGKVTDFDAPLVSAHLSSEGIDLQSQFKLIEKTLNINSLKGRYLGSAFDMEGNVFLGETPSFDASGKLELALKDLSSLLPAAKEQLSALALDGEAVLEGALKGPLTNPENWQTDLDAKSQRISIKGYTLQNLTATLSQNEQHLLHLKGSANAYEGKLFLVSSLDLANRGLPFSFDGKIKNADIARLRMDTALKNEDISGLLSVDLSFSGNLRDADSFDGKGYLSVQDGRLWQLNLLKGLGNFLFIPEFENIIFNEAQGDFLIRDKKISTGNLEFISPQAVLTCFGWVDFGGNLNLDIASEFSEETIANSASLKKLATVILTQGEAYLTIKVTGTLKNPQYAVSPTGVVHKTKRLILDGLKNIFE